jgi:16S rRNA (guanine(966)-N(2))-methyltransferase RsmD
MRIISGKYKGRKVDGYTIDGTRPTMDRVKESVLGMIQTKLEDSICLDLFTGSGSVGLELLSNGAKKCYFVDNNYKVIETLNKNMKSLKITDDYEIIKSGYEEALKNFNNRNIKFDIIFLDPPYKLDYIIPAIKLISDYNLINEDGLIICEYENEEIDVDNYELIKTRKYGSKKIKIYKK